MNFWGPQVTSIFDTFGGLIPTYPDPSGRPDPDGICAEVRRCADLTGRGGGWVSVMFAHGTSLDVDVGWLHDWRQACANRGVAFHGWLENRTDPEGEVALCAQIAAETGMTGIGADAEVYHKGDDPRGDPRRSDVFTAAFEHTPALTRLDKVFTTMGAASAPNVLGDVRDDNRGPMHFRCWYQRGWWFAPQAYPNEFPGPTRRTSVYDPERCVWHAQAAPSPLWPHGGAGWPLARVAVMVGLYGNFGANNWTGEEYGQALDGTGISAANVFLLDETTGQDLTDLATHMKGWKPVTPTPPAGPSNAAETRKAMLALGTAQEHRWPASVDVMKQRVGLADAILRMPDVAFAAKRAGIRSAIEG